MRRSITAIVIALAAKILFEFHLPSHAATLPNSFDIKGIDNFLAAEVQKKGRVGLTVAIMKDGKIVLAKGYGKRSLEKNLPVEPDTLFAIGSVTKQFVCASALLLAEDGRLSVHDKVAKYFPNLTRAGDISVLDLMNHTSGYPDYYPLDFLDRRMLKPATGDEIIAKYATGKLDFEPGSNWSYSNTGYTGLGRVIEKVSGKSLGDFLRERIYQPLRLDHTAYEPDPADPRVAVGYTSFLLSDSQVTPPEAKGWAGAAGGIYSTPTDLAMWDLALCTGKVLKPESFALMTTSRRLNSGRIVDYGCGINVRIVERKQVLDHGGAVSGYSTWNGIVPATQSAVIMIANRDQGLGALPRTILGLLMKEKVESTVPKINGLSAVDTVKKILAEFQEGKVNRGQFAEEYNWYLTPEKLATAAMRLKAFGKPNQATVQGLSERGGMEVSTVRLTFNSGTLRTLMYRRPDGIIEQFFVDED